MKTPMMYVDHVVMQATMMRQISPGISPNASKADGIDRTPRPICVFIMRATVPSQPSCERVSV